MAAAQEHIIQSIQYENVGFDDVILKSIGYTNFCYFDWYFISIPSIISIPSRRIEIHTQTGKTFQEDEKDWSIINQFDVDTIGTEILNLDDRMIFEDKQKYFSRWFHILYENEDNQYFIANHHARFYICYYNIKSNGTKIVTDDEIHEIKSDTEHYLIPHVMNYFYANDKIIIVMNSKKLPQKQYYCMVLDIPTQQLISYGIVHGEISHIKKVHDIVINEITYIMFIHTHDEQTYCSVVGYENQKFDNDDLTNFFEIDTDDHYHIRYNIIRKKIRINNQTFDL